MYKIFCPNAKKSQVQGACRIRSAEIFKAFKLVCPSPAARTFCAPLIFCNVAYSEIIKRGFLDTDFRISREFLYATGSDKNILATLVEMGQGIVQDAWELAHPVSIFGTVCKDTDDLIAAAGPLGLILGLLNISIVFEPDESKSSTCDPPKVIGRGDRVGLETYCIPYYNLPVSYSVCKVVDSSTGSIPANAGSVDFDDFAIRDLCNRTLGRLYATVAASTSYTLVAAPPSIYPVEAPPVEVGGLEGFTEAADVFQASPIHWVPDYVSYRMVKSKLENTSLSELAHIEDVPKIDDVFCVTRRSSLPYILALYPAEIINIKPQGWALNTEKKEENPDTGLDITAWELLQVEDFDAFVLNICTSFPAMPFDSFVTSVGLRDYLTGKYSIPIAGTYGTTQHVYQVKNFAIYDLYDISRPPLTMVGKAALNINYTAHLERDGLILGLPKQNQDLSTPQDRVRAYLWAGLTSDVDGGCVGFGDGVVVYSEEYGQAESPYNTLGTGVIESPFTDYDFTKIKIVESTHHGLL